ncbi:MAG: hypothetical protein MUE60_11575 [Candidatus Eisenbacteria bacterium]|nr:hypothetical protein [Candidatus Eisenbacteria bacterium]
MLELSRGGEIARFHGHDCHERMTPDAVAQAISAPAPMSRSPRLYMVLSPIEFIVLSSLAPSEYAWYATHRPGKVFRQIAFTELKADQPHLAAESRFAAARTLMQENPEKKTKTVVTENCFNSVPIRDWSGYGSGGGGLYVGDRSRLCRWSFPPVIPEAWDRAEG